MSLADAVTWWPEEIAALRPPDDLTVSEWADRHRVLEPQTHAHPGPWRTDFAPYLRGIMDAWSDPDCREVVCKGSTQWGKTEGAINCTLWQVSQAPMPVMWVMPTEQDVLSFAARRLKPALQYCEPTAARLSPHKSDNLTHEIAYDGGALYFAWAGSPSRLASRSIGRVMIDEADKFLEFAGREAPPIELARERLRWWTDSKLWVSSTPTVAGGYISQAWLESDRRWYHVPCPRCGLYQPLRFSRETVRWPADERDPVRIEQDRLACYVCVGCEAELPDDDRTKERMLLAGVWVPDGGTVDGAGRVRGVELTAPIRGFHVNALYSPMLTWSAVAAKFLRAQGDRGRLMHFTNSWLGWEWVETSTDVRYEHVQRRQVDHEQGVVPADAIALTCGVDVQEQVIYWTVRAHFGGGRSHTVEAGVAGTLPELEVLVLDRPWPVDADDAKSTAAPRRVDLMCIDSGYRTDEVYAWTMLHSERVRPVKGLETPQSGVPIQASRVERSWQGKAVGLQLWRVQVAYFKDRLARRILTDLGTRDAWSVHRHPSDDYLRHMTSEHRELARNKKTGQVVERWVPKPGGGANHWWDCEVYADAAADMLHLYHVRTEEQVERLRQAREHDQQRRERVAAKNQERRDVAARMAARRKGWRRR